MAGSGPPDATLRRGPDRRVPPGRRPASRPGHDRGATGTRTTKGHPAPERPGYDLGWELAVELFEQAGNDSVRAIEALAAALVNRLRGRLAVAPGRAADDHASRPPPAATLSPEAEQRFQICRRIARRSLGGSLPDPTGGATAFHRIGEHPAWAEDLLPVAEIGPFLFYRPGGRHPVCIR